MTRISSLTLALLLAAGTAQAQWYAGGSVGQAETSLDGGRRSAELVDLGFLSASTSVDDRDTAYRLYAGYRLHRYVASELAYVDLGEYTLSSTVAPAGTLRTRIRHSGAELSVLGLLPIGETFTLFGKVGVIALRSRAEFSGSGSVRVFDDSGSHSSRRSGASYGVGMMADFGPRWSARVEYNRYEKVGGELTGGDSDAKALFAGLQYRF